MKVLVTGGTGYIGSHTVIELLAQGHSVVIADNHINSSPVVLERITDISGVRPGFYELDVCDQLAVNAMFANEQFDAVIHFAALKAVGESVSQPMRYFQNNIGSLMTICAAMDEHAVRRLIFSSSATVYGTPDHVPVDESADARRATNPYGATKVVGEEILQSLAQANPDWRITLLRYFNPVGAHPSGTIGEDPVGTPNNLVPFVAQVAVGKRPTLTVYGENNTPDGTGIRDYIHVSDLARGHVAALNHQPKPSEPDIYNLGCGKGYSVLEVIEAFKKVSGKDIPYQMVGRRPGDVDKVVADASKAERELNWKTEKTLEDMCADSWRWQSQNPNGFAANT